MHNTNLHTSIIAKQVYGESPVTQDSWLNYAYALLTIAGADGEVSQAEFEWITNEFLVIIEAPEEFKEQLKQFNYTEASLEKVLKKIKFNASINYKRALLYDAIKMANADDEYSSDEKKAVQKASELLEIPIYVARTIEGLVNTERSLQYMRRSIFQVDNSATSVKTNASLKALLGITAVTDDIQQEYGEALMIIAGADGIVSEGERNWYLNEFVPTAKTPPEIVEKVLSFDFRRASLKDYLEKLGTFKHINFNRTLVYNGIRMAKADGDYAKEEQEAIMQSGKPLQVPENMISTMEYLINTEENIEKMRKTLFFEKKW